MRKIFYCQSVNANDDEELSEKLSVDTHTKLYTMCVRGERRFSEMKVELKIHRKRANENKSSRFGDSQTEPKQDAEQNQDTRCKCTEPQCFAFQLNKEKREK